MPFITKLGAVAARAYGWIATTVSAAVNDTYFYLVALLLPGNGTNGAQNNTFLDSSTNNFTITRNGNTTQGTFSPFSQTGWSNYFDGSGDYLSIASNAAFNFGTGDFTIEFWLFLPSPSTTQVFLDIRNAGVGLVFYSSGGVLYVNKDNSGSVLITGSSLTGFTWLHVALSRSGGANRLFINGVQSGNTVTDSTNYPTNPVYIGGNFSGGQLTTGYISNLRIVKGVALYTNSFTPPATPLTAVSGTSLLTCQSNRLIDNSANNFTITRNGDVAVQAFSPFAPNNISPTSYSGWFDGSGDYLTTPSNAAFTFGTGDFCYEFWVFHTVSGVVETYADQTANGFGFAKNTANKLELAQSGVTVIMTSVGTVPINQWAHVAVTRSGTSVRMFINGVLDSTATLATNFSATSAWYISRQALAAVGYITGALSNLRIVKGTAVYTSNFTPPTVPLTAIANTSLLTLQNATFIDNSTNAFTITVNGNAQPITNNPFQTPSPNPISYSGYFDGSGDYLSIPSNAAFTLGAGDFTIDVWIYTANITNTYIRSIAATYSFVSSLDRGWFLGLTSTGYPQFGLYNSSGVQQFTIVSSVITPTNQWTHLAAVRSGSAVKLYLNGVQVGSATSSANDTVQFSDFTIGTIRSDNLTPAIGNSGTSFLGYISNLRIVKGTALYTANFIPPNTPLTAVSGTSLLTCQDNRFVDNSTNAFAITVNGNTTPVMTNPYGYATPISSTAYGGAFDGGTTTRLTFPSNTAFAFGTGAYTMEAWVYLTSYATTFSTAIFDCGSTTNSAGMFVTTSGALFLNLYGVGSVIQTSTTIPLNTWTHIAISRQSTAASSTRLFINGVLGATGTDSNNWTVTTTPGVGGIGLAGYTVNGFVSNVRIVKGTAVYTAAFTPSTTPLTAISGTSLLTCQNIVFADNSSNAFTITVNGNTAPTPVNPFGYSAPAAPTPVSYSALTNGGSGYFDGTGDYLTLANNAALDLSSGDFTVEGWFYSFSTSGIRPIISRFNGNYATGSDFQYNIYASGTSLIVRPYSGGTDYTITVGTITANTWNHVSLVRTGNTFYGFLNGVRAATSQTITGSLNTGTWLTYTGGVFSSTLGNDYFYGYLSNLRVVKGTAVYTSNFTPPPAPVTAVSNTQLLLNYTNAGIADAASQNVLETVGNAQISTAQSKWGGGSMAFDGTGDYLTVPDSPAWFLSTGNFTIELWIYFSSTASLSMLVQQGLNINNRWILYYSTTTGMSFDVASAAATIITCQQGSTAGWATNTWYHVAVVRNGNAFNIYRNGTSIASATDTDSIPDFAGPLYIGGGAFSGDVSLNGYIDDLRITKFARYTANFTPPTAAFPTQ